MFVVTVMFVVRPERTEDFRREMVANARASLAHEPGCRQFDVAVDPQNPATIFLYELYDDRAAFDMHLASAHFRSFDATVAGWTVSKLVHMFQRIEP